MTDRDLCVQNSRTVQRWCRHLREGLFGLANCDRYNAVLNETPSGTPERCKPCLREDGKEVNNAQDT